MIKILITGANAQLAQEFKERCSGAYSLYSLTRQELDITNFQRVYEVIKDVKPKIVINCAAYNLVDKAESDRIEAYRVNTIGVANLAMACAEVRALLVHYSTDYVFDGEKEDFYTEEDAPNPLNEYGKSKLLGEIAVQQTMENYLIFRTSWVYGRGKQNFLHKLMQWVQSREYLKIACDEFSVPTFTKSIAEVTLKAIDKGLVGLYHFVNSGYASRYEWAKEYFRLKGIKKLIYPAYRLDFNLPAKRPKWSVMSNNSISSILNIDIPHWQEAIAEAVKLGYV